MTRRLLICLGMLVLIGGAGGCGGGGGGANSATAPSATQLVYRDPADTTQWRLVKDGASTSTQLVLDLLAPHGSAGRGVTLVLSADPEKVGWQALGGSSLVQNLAFTGNLASRASVLDGDLRVLLTQTPGTPIQYGDTPLLSVALELKGQVQAGTIPLSASQSAHLGTSATPEAITIAVGTLTCQ